MRNPAALAVACPSCGAAPGQLCRRLQAVGSSGHRESFRSHATRLRVVEEQNRQTRTIR